MDQKKSAYVSMILFSCFLGVSIILAACTAQTKAITPTLLPTSTLLPPTAIQPTPTPTDVTRLTLSADEVKTLASEFVKVSSAHIDAWNEHDYNLIGQFYTDDAMYYERSFGFPSFSGSSGVASMAESVLSDEPEFNSRQVDAFIGREDGFDIWELWNYSEEAGITKENPAVAYDWISLREGKIAVWWIFWSPETMEKLWTPGQVPDDELQQDYATAWSSGDPETITSLYDPKIVRTDTLFGENQEGSTALKEFIANFFSWYPGVRLELLQPFYYSGSSLSLKMDGGVYAIHASDQTGKPCDVHAAILMKVVKNKIVNEWLFYKADSLVACGWAQ